MKYCFLVSVFDLMIGNNCLFVLTSGYEKGTF